ncbi:MAG TPA: DUF2306 domain-containing protein, partial [Phenylobacterium sp.]
GGAATMAAVVAARMIARPPRFELIEQAGPVVQIHLAAVAVAFAVGAVQLLGPKGTFGHRVLGWSWSLAMMATAISSLFIKGVIPGSFSPIHLLSVFVLVALPGALVAAHRHKVTAHAKAMTSIYLGGMVIAGGFTFLPGRLMWQVFFG